jgi:hypothetical protein
MPLPNPRTGILWEQRCQPWDFIPRSWDFLKRLGYFWDFILRNETLGFFLGFLRNSQEK